MPISKAMILLTTNGVASLNLNSFNSSMNLFRTHWNLQSQKGRKLRQTDMNTRRKSHQAVTGPSSPQSCWITTPIRYLDCARTPLTSAKRSETIWKLRLLGPTSALKAARNNKKNTRKCLFVEGMEEVEVNVMSKGNPQSGTYGSRYLKCLKVVFSSCVMSCSWPGWNGSCEDRKKRHGSFHGTEDGSSVVTPRIVTP